MQYYIQRHASGYVGNCLLWWRKGGRGYTCNLDDAEVFDDVRGRRDWDTETYTVWDKQYIDSCAHRHVDHQCVDKDRSGADSDAAFRAWRGSRPTDGEAFDRVKWDYETRDMKIAWDAAIKWYDNRSNHGRKDKHE